MPIYRVWNKVDLKKIKFSIPWANHFGVWVVNTSETTSKMSILIILAKFRFFELGHLRQISATKN